MTYIAVLQCQDGKLYPDCSRVFHGSSVTLIDLEGHDHTHRIFSSPEHEVLMVSYCDQSLSVVCALSTFCFERLLQNGLMDFEIILQEGSLGDPQPK